MNRFREMFYGKCGFDTLNKTILALGSLFLFPAAVFDLTPLAFGFLICLLLCLYRALSPDLKARQRENRMLLDILSGIAVFFRLRLRMARESKTRRYFKCVKCGTWLRVPIGKGKISVRCSKCGICMIKKT